MSGECAYWIFMGVIFLCQVHGKCEMLIEQYNKCDILTGDFAMCDLSLGIFIGVVFWLTKKRITKFWEKKHYLEQNDMCDITPGNM